MIGRNRFLSVDASPLDSAVNGSGVLGVYAAYGALSPMNLISGSCSSDNAADEGFISHRDWSGGSRSPWAGWDRTSTAGAWAVLCGRARKLSVSSFRRRLCNLLLIC